MVHVPAASIVTFKPLTVQTDVVTEVSATVRPELEVGAGVMAKGVVLNARSLIVLKVIAWLAFCTTKVKLCTAGEPIPFVAVNVRG